MALSNIDRKLLHRCLARQPRAWEDFVDRFLGLVVHVVGHTGKARSIRLTTQDSEDLAAEVFLAFVNDDYAILRRFRGESSLATYLTVVARRVTVRELLKRRTTSTLSEAVQQKAAQDNGSSKVEERFSNRDEVDRLMDGLKETEAEVIRLYHLEGKTYQEISSTVGMSENSIGPTLSRAREKMRRASAADSTS